MRGSKTCSVALPAAEEVVANESCPRSEQEGKEASSLAGQLLRKNIATPHAGRQCFTYTPDTLCFAFLLHFN
jgi:hypothetical protein